MIQSIFKEPLSIQLTIAIKLINLGIPVWDEYYKTNKIEYIDSVVGLYHKTKKSLPSRIINTSRKLLKEKNKLRIFYYKFKIRRLYKEILEPSVALIDDDFTLPENVYSFFKGVYYLNDSLVKLNKSEQYQTSLELSIKNSIETLIEANLKSKEEIENFINLPTS